jgi:hypothetical protein
MSMSPEVQQAKMKEFMSLLPLTVAIAGLPHSDLGKYFNEGQLEVRMNILRQAYKMARQLVIEISAPQEGQS